MRMTRLHRNGNYAALRGRPQSIFRLAVIIGLLSTTSAVVVTAQPSRAGKDKTLDKKKIAVQVKLSLDRVHPGSACFAMLIVNIQDGWHINSTTPLEENLIGTSVEIQKRKVIDSTDIHYPKGIERKFGFADTPLDVYEGTIQILIKLSVATDVKPGTYSVPATIHYQACNDNLCLAPASVRIDISLRIVSRGEPVSRINPKLFEGYQEVLKQ